MDAGNSAKTAPVALSSAMYFGLELTVTKQGKQHAP
jgi:hypothetical protein